MTSYILGIESSCDDTGAAIVSSKKDILSNIVISQNKEHALFQGVVPEIAARSHLKNLSFAIEQSLMQAEMSLAEIDAIAATTGPGLIGGVLVGSVFGKTISEVLNKPFFAINHLEGHALTARLSNSVAYPYLLLLVSGGHCQFVAVQDLGKYYILGKTLDDAVGEAFDKVAKMLDLPFPGGPEIEKRSKLGNKYQYSLPQPIIHQYGCNMSFSGLKTAVRVLINQLEDKYQKLDDTMVNDIAASFQHTVSEVLSCKLLVAIKQYEVYLNILHKTIVVSGGVAANQYLRERLNIAAKSSGYEIIFPPVNLCTDNAAMIAWAGMERLESGIVQDSSFKPKSRWNLDEVKC